MLTLIDSFDATQPGNRPVSIKPEGAARTETILGREALVLPPITDSASFAAFLIGEGRGLVAGRPYVLEFDYPDDVPRTIAFLNRGADLVRTVATGKEIGDYREQYAYPNPESLSYPHTNQWQTYRFYFYLHDRFLPLVGVRNEVDTKRPFGPADGFWVAVGHFNPKGIPLSRGAAVGGIRLYEVTNPNAAKLVINYPPGGLPHRRTYWREEMGDGPAICQRGDSVVQTDPSAPNYHSSGICNPATGSTQASVTAWLEYKMKLAQVLGINVFTKDLLEFGYNQGMAMNNYGGGKLYSSARVAYWPQMVQKAQTYGLEVMPYFEYYGAMGDGEYTGMSCPSVNATGHDVCAQAFNSSAYQCAMPWGQNQPRCFLPSYGKQKPCEPLTRDIKRYTPYSWAEVACIDVSDPAALDDVKKLLNANLLDLRNSANFAGVWFRTRVGSWPISFSAETRARYAADRNRVLPGKEELRADPNLLKDYHNWWFDKRRAYLLAIRDYLRSGKNGNDGVPEASVLFTSYHEEGLPIPAPNWEDAKVVTDDVTTWNNINLDNYWKWRYSPVNFSTWLSNKRYESMLFSLPLPTNEQLASGSTNHDELGHGTPPADPQRYQSDEGVLLTLPYGRQFTVADTALLQKFSNASGLALSRHFPLNEDDGKGSYSTDSRWPMSGYFGYFVTDVERSSPYTMLAEVRALAKADANWIGYLSSNSFNTGAPQDLRRFNAAYLAWPAMPSQIAAGASSDGEVVVRDMETPQGKFLAVFNTGMQPKSQVEINLSATRLGATTSLQDRVSNQRINTPGSRLRIDLPVAGFRVFAK